MNYEQIKYSVDQQIATITLNRPDKLNAYTAQMQAELIDAFDQVDADDTVRAVIVTGAGRGYCAGADLSAGADTFNYEARPDRPERQGAVRADGSVDWDDERTRDGGGVLSLRIYECLKPVIGAINGPAVGVGATMQLPMDFRLASTEARFGFVFTRRGVVPEAASSYFLPRVVGISQALEWCFTGRVFSAQEAKEGGLVRSLHAPDELLPAATALAREIADNTAQVSVTLTRQMLWKMLGADHPMEAHRIESKGILERGRSDDAKEGVTSFLEKRQPNYPNRTSKDLPGYFPWWEKRTYS